MANSVDPDQVDPDQTPQNAASAPSVYCLIKPSCPKTYCNYTNLIKFCPHSTPSEISNPLLSSPISTLVLSRTGEIVFQSFGKAVFRDCYIAYGYLHIL